MNARNRTRGRSNGRPSRGGRSHSHKPKQSKSFAGRLAAWLKSLFGGGKAPQVPINSSRLYVGNLPYKTGQKELQELFSQYGAVIAAEVIIDRSSNRSKGFGFVEMESIEEARVAANKLHNREYDGRKLIVSGAKAETKDANAANTTRREFSSDVA
ncbi:RNA-binding protein [Oscillatoria laete-virens NRMC-F 0139]|nr:RNA-binding protein [Oscillatoria laete-virens]MDL5054777.1 RNA-binding protein [Oscillatoria laete-virens NRMC-F 0139]